VDFLIELGRVGRRGEAQKISAQLMVEQGTPNTYPPDVKRRHCRCMHTLMAMHAHDIDG